MNPQLQFLRVSRSGMPEATMTTIIQRMSHETGWPRLVPAEDLSDRANYYVAYRVLDGIALGQLMGQLGGMSVAHQTIKPSELPVAATSRAGLSPVMERLVALLVLDSPYGSLFEDPAVTAARRDAAVAGYNGLSDLFSRRP